MKSETEYQLKEFTGWYEANDEDIPDDRLEELNKLIEDAYNDGSGYAALLKVHHMQHKNIEEMFSLLKEAASAGYGQAMLLLATEGFPNITDIERYAYMKLSDPFWVVELEEIGLSDDDKTIAEELCEKLKSELHVFYEIGNETLDLG